LDSDLIHPCAVIGPEVKLGPDCSVGPFCHFEGRVVAGARNRFHVGVCIGGPPMDRKYQNEETEVRIGSDNLFHEYSTVHRAVGEGEATTIADECCIMTYVHIAHNCRIGTGCVLTSGVQLGGHVEVGDGANIGGLAGVHQFTRIGRLAMVGACSYANKDIPPFFLAAGNPCRVRGVNAIGLSRAGFTPDDIAVLRRAFRLIYRSGLNLTQALQEVEQLPGPYVAELVSFIGSTSRGIELRTGPEPDNTDT
jgi:UDP-N-acetylglucosamine acyltransferase